MIDMPPTPPVIEALIKCGLNPSGLAIEYVDDFQSDVLEIKIAAGGDSSMIPCIVEATWPEVIVEIEDGSPLKAPYKAYQTQVGEQYLEQMRLEARAWFADRGLLDKLPDPPIGTSQTDIAQEVEEFCGFEQGTALYLYAPGLLTIKVDAFSLPLTEQLQCLLKALLVIDLKKHGLEFGFIGSGAFAEEESK